MSKLVDRYGRSAGITVTCCYCGNRQFSERPPALVTCNVCKRDFRIFYNVGQKSTIELTDAAKHHFARKRDGVT